jgi:hypothetical protein
MSADYDHQLNLINIYRANARLFVQQRASFGDLCPPHIITQLVETRNKIKSLRAALLNYYNVQIEDEPGTDYDVDDTVTITLDRTKYLRIREIVARYGFDLPDIE